MTRDECSRMTRGTRIYERSRDGPYRARGALELPCHSSVHSGDLHGGGLSVGGDGRILPVCVLRDLGAGPQPRVFDRGAPPFPGCRLLRPVSHSARRQSAVQMAPSTTSGSRGKRRPGSAHSPTRNTLASSSKVVTGWGGRPGGRRTGRIPPKGMFFLAVWLIMAEIANHPVSFRTTGETNGAAGQTRTILPRGAY